MKKINLFLIATAKYTQYLQPLITSADKFFLPGHEVTYCVFTNDSNLNITTNREVEYFPVEHKKFPYPSLMRFDFFSRYRVALPLSDYSYYVDVDVLFVDTIGDEIFGDLVAVQHCGFVGERGTYEERPISTAYVAPHEGKKYYGGGFQGGGTKFWDAIEAIKLAIEIDLSKGIIAVHHDESQWNRYLVHNPPTLELNPSYHHPDSHEHIHGKWKKLGLWFPPKVLLLNKDHEAMRN